MWVLTGAFTGLSDNRAALFKYPDERLDSMRAFARFPQGLPVGLDLTTLKPRPSKATTDH
jgi:hypothetical protein